MKPKISVILPVYNNAEYLEETLDSVLAQTFQDWELLAVNEYGSDDGSAEIIRRYQERDARIYLVQNTEKLGLAESLNKGMRLAQGAYLARLDADDLAHPRRFEKQYEYMESTPEIGICGSYQQHFGFGVSRIHKPPVRPDDMKAALLFHCNFCHSTVMLRRKTVLDNQLFYDENYLAEDFELWSRAISVTKIANIPEVLGASRKRLTNSTSAKMPELAAEHGRIVAKTLKQLLDIDLTERQMEFFQGWCNPFLAEKSHTQRQKNWAEFERLLREIYRQNQKKKVFADESLLNVLAVEWRYVKHNKSPDWSGEKMADNIEDVFEETHMPALLVRYRQFRENNPRWQTRMKKLVKHALRPVASFFRSVVKSSMRDCLEDLDHGIERWTWDRYKRVRQDMTAQENRWQWSQNSIPYKRGEKIRIGILFQIPSCWASIESVWELLSADERFDAKMYLFDLEQREPAQMAGAREFLTEQGIPFVSVDRFTFAKENLHILLYQTPWDATHRPDYLQSDKIAQLGTRIAYITYGLGYSASVWEGHRFSDTKLKAYPWKIFVFSPQMRFDHICLSPRGGQNVVGVGHPKFDAIAHKEQYPLEPEVAQRIQGRKIVFLQMHFPAPDGNPSIPEADIHAYIDFLKHAAEYPEFFFLVRPHPKLLEVCEQRELTDVADALKEVLVGQDNVFHYAYPDYRPALFAADYVIGDRSALMIEAGALDVPVLYMTNFYYKEKMLPSVAPLFESYYQGSFAYDIHLFLDMVARRGNDYKKEERQQAAREYLPALDGLGSQRIVDAIAEAIYKEEAVNA